MKFRDGMWLTAADKHVEYAECIYSITEQERGRALDLLCPTKKIRYRGDTLNCPTLTIRLKAEFDGVVSIEVTHWAGECKRKPNFELFPNGKPACSADTQQDASGSSILVSGSLCVVVKPDPQSFSIHFRSTENEETVTELLERSVGFAYNPPPGNQMQVEDMTSFKHHLFTQTELSVGESVHGLGERFGPFNRVGQNVDIWNADGGTSSDQAYKNIPFWLSSRGYGVFIDTPERIDLEIGSERCCRVQTSVEAQRLKWYLIRGANPKQVLRKYSILTGRAPLLPAWSFGLWLSTSFTTNYDEDTVSGFLEEMRCRHIPVEVFHYDCFWLRSFHWCDFVFSKEHFPDPKSSMARLKADNLLKKICVWINPYIGQASPVFDYAAEKGYLLKRENGDVWQWDLWQAGMGLVDFTNPDACEWYTSCLEKLFDAGVDCLKTDFGERIPVQNIRWHDSSLDSNRMHNFYAFLYNKLVYEAVSRRHGPDQAVLFARTATAGTQRFPLCWGGDCESTPAALAESVRGGLSLGLSGFSFWSCDIGGFEGSPKPWIYKRWVAFGLFCSHSRLHGSGSYRVPWLIDGDDQGQGNATEVLRTFVRMKRKLMPYLYAQAVESTQDGLPLSLRALCLEFPDDPTCWFLDRQFMVGDSLLVAPVFNEEGNVSFYLPKGRWTSLWNDDLIIDGPRWVQEKHGFNTLPAYVKEGTILVLGKEESEEGEGFDYEWTKQGGEIKLYHISDQSKAKVVDSSGKGVVALAVDKNESIEGLSSLQGEWTVIKIGG